MLTLSQPVFYALELTTACDNHCTGCSNVFSAGRLPLSAVDWRRALSGLTSRAHVLKLTGGEPTLHPDFLEIIHAVEETGIPFTLFTNARCASRRL